MKHIDAKMALAIKTLDEQAAQESITQRAVDEVIVGIENLQPSTKQTVLEYVNSFIGNMAAGAWLQVIIQHLK